MDRETMLQRAEAYVASLRKTGQWRKSYWYTVVFEGGRITGHVPSPKQTWAHDAADKHGLDHCIILKGSMV